ncbi:MAG: fructose-6-phosphate aldolase [Rickettsiales bacterium]|nr:MAG: fructose-6-phosphate aldolase [Rickettsiales bacterium]
MEIFLDSIDFSEIKKYQNLGIIDGVTTNPTLMANSKKGFYETAEQICELVKGDVSIEVAATSFEDMVKEGNKIFAIASNVVLKLPITWEGLKACRNFTDKGQKVNMTLCFTANQALLAAKCGATYISPFIGRLDDINEDGMQLIIDTRTIYNNFNYKTKILSASIRNVEHVMEAALYGSDVATISPQILSQLVKHDLTDQGLKKFSDDWANSGMKI